jgi:hypothetical protein
MFFTEAPTSKHQAPEKHQAPNFKAAHECLLVEKTAESSGRWPRAGEVCLEVEVWGFSGAWMLELGA